jgi:pimeloyl-ACP methyl ester carboxylesterase
MPSRASAILVATAATLGAMTAYNLYRARKAEREHPPTGRFVTVDRGALAMRHRYQELTMPVVIIAGAEDRVINANQPGRLHAQIPHSILRLVPGVGHMIHYAVPEQVVAAIEEAGRLVTTKLRNTRQALHTASAA